MLDNTNPEYLVAIHLPILENDDKFEEEGFFHEPDLFSFDEIEKIKKYISNIPENKIFLIEQIEPNYNLVYREEGDWNYEDTSATWNIVSEKKGKDKWDIISAIKEWTFESTGSYPDITD